MILRAERIAARSHDSDGLPKEYVRAAVPISRKRNHKLILLQ